MAEAEGAYSLVVLTRNAVYGIRDPQGFRPLCIGRLPEGGYVLASESCALGTVSAAFVREVEPGEIIRLDAAGFHSIAPKPQASGSSLCVFEYVYFARPDSMLEGQTIHRVRQRLGEILAAEAPVAADVIVGVPDSATPAAIGYATASGIPYTEGLIKNRYIGRTFIQPSDQLRRSGVHLKYNPLEANLTGKRVVLIDDSIVRGTTAGPLVTLLREGGAAEVHVRVSSPPVRHPCFMGIDMADSEELIGFVKTVEEIRDHIGADSLAYLTMDGMMRAVEEEAVDTRGHCNGCFSGNYPIDLGTFWNDRYKLAFQSAWSETGEME
jgi:amidophosphoribosyltransferase